MDGFSAIVGSDGADLSLADLARDEVYLNHKAASELRVEPGAQVVVYAAGVAHEARVRDVVSFEGAGTADAALLVPLATAQEFFGHPGEIRAVLVSNRGDAFGGAALSDEVAAILSPVAAERQLEVQTVKQDAIEAADEAGAAFVAFFTTFCRSDHRTIHLGADQELDGAGLPGGLEKPGHSGRGSGGSDPS